MTFLLDVNVLIALIDQGHVQHDMAHGWFAAVGMADFATCPLTENGVLRIMGNPRYPGSPGAPAALVPALVSFRAMPGHTFWSNDLSLVACEDVEAERLLSASQVTDTYLLALAARRGGRLATFDGRMVLDAVPAGAAAFELIA